MGFWQPIVIELAKWVLATLGQYLYTEIKEARLKMERDDKIDEVVAEIESVRENIKKQKAKGVGISADQKESLKRAHRRLAERIGARV